MNWHDFVSIPNPAHVLALWNLGKERGNRSRIFAKVGESNSFWRHNLGLIGAGLAILKSDNLDLRPIIRYYSRATARIDNSFSDPSMACIRGALVEEQLKPYTEVKPTHLYYSHLVPAGQSALVAYYDLINPSVSVIMLGTNDWGKRTTEFTVAGIEAVIDETLSRFIIPILTTIPPLHHTPARDVQPINEGIRQLAITRGLPLIDLYAALLLIPDEGIIADGTHLTYSPDGNSADLTEAGLRYGYNLRNLLTLIALDEVYKVTHSQ